MFEDKPYELFNGDCLEVMDKLIKDGIKVDTIICDPPYGTTSCKWDNIIPFDEMWKRLNKITKKESPILLFGSEPFASNLRTSNIKQYKYDWYWDRLCKSGYVYAKYRPMSQIELILVFGKGKITYNPQMIQLTEEEYKKKISKLPKKAANNNNHMYAVGAKAREDTDISNFDKSYPSNIIKVNARAKECNTRNKLHPTQKPIELLEYLIKTYTNENEIVLDFTMGSGSTGVACLNTGRKFIGIELEENYFEIAKERIENTNKED